MQVFCGGRTVSVAYSEHLVDYADATVGMLLGELHDGPERNARASHGCRQFKIDNRTIDV